MAIALHDEQSVSDLARRHPMSFAAMVIESFFPTLEAMEQLIAMGMEEGITLAVGQIDDLLNWRT